MASKCPFSHVLLLWSNSLTREEAQWYKNLTFVAFSKSSYWVLYHCASRKESPSFGLQHQHRVAWKKMQWRSWLRPCVTLSKIAAWGRLLSIKNETFCLSEHSVWKYLIRSHIRTQISNTIILKHFCQIEGIEMKGDLHCFYDFLRFVSNRKCLNFYSKLV